MFYTPLSQRKQQSYPQSGDTVSNIMERLSSVESGGRYDALGPEVTSGMYAGEQALGKWQVMPGNLPDWSREALGREVTPDEFLSNPQLQDSIVRDRMSKIYDQYGNEEDVASVWFSGRPVSQAGDAADVTGTSVPEYIRRFREAGGQRDNRLVYTPLSQRTNNL